MIRPCARYVPHVCQYIRPPAFAAFPSLPGAVYKHEVYESLFRAYSYAWLSSLFHWHFCVHLISRAFLILFFFLTLYTWTAWGKPADSIDGVDFRTQCRNFLSLFTLYFNFRYCTVIKKLANSHLLIWISCKWRKVNRISNAARLLRKRKCFHL